MGGKRLSKLSLRSQVGSLVQIGLLREKTLSTSQMKTVTSERCNTDTSYCLIKGIPKIINNTQ